MEEGNTVVLASHEEESLVLRPKQSIPLMGQAVMRVVSGQAQVYGRILGATDGPQHLVSSPFTALLLITNPSHELPAEVLLSSLWNGMEHLALRSGGRFIGFDPKENSRPCSYRLAAPGGAKLLELPQSWWDVAAAVSSHLSGRGDPSQQLPPRIFILGNRKVGKSSFCRFLTNTLLNVRREVAFMDLDCGQTEFTPPGFLSLKLLTEALLGPPPRHAGPTDACKYLGFAGVDAGVRLYCETARDLFLEYQGRASLAEAPLIVNTMGWTTGMGFMLQQYLVQTMRPTHIIVVKTAAPTDRPDDEPIPDYIWELLYGRCELSFAHCKPYSPKDPINVAAVLSPVASTRDGERARVVDPSDLRDLMWLSYFQQRATAKGIHYTFPSSLSELVPLAISWDAVDLIVTPSPAELPQEAIVSLLNEAVVGLAPRAADGVIPPYEPVRGRALHGLPRIFRARSGASLPLCHGAALIRSVDPVRRLLYVLTPIPLDQLVSFRLSTLILTPGFVLPRTIILQAHETTEEAPYINFLGHYTKSAASNRKVRGNISRRYRAES